MLRIALSFLAVVTLTGCPGGGMLLDSLDFPENEPNTNDLVGVYLPDAATLKDIRERGHYPDAAISITLREDGTFSCTNIPDWWMADFGKASGRFIDATGTWKVARQQRFWQIELEWISSNTGHQTSINLVGATAPFILRIYMGDPDEGRVMQFTRREENPRA